MKHFLLASFLLLAACGGSSRLPAAPVTPVATAPAISPQRARLAAHRAENLAHLHDYWVAGEFPLDANQWPVSVFRDEAGRECPMAALISQSGYEALTTAMVQQNNRLRLADVHAGPLQAWILDSGLTRDEVVMIQGAMDFQPFSIELAPGQRELQIAATHREIRARIRTMERTLRAATEHSLELAEAALPKDATGAPWFWHVPSAQTVSLQVMMPRVRYR